MRMEAVVAYFEVLTERLSRKTEEQKKTQ